MKKITLEDIGKIFGISKVAVHKALNDKKGLSEELREKVKKKAEELGYTKYRASGINGMNFLYIIKKHFFLSASEQFYSPIYYYLNKEYEKLNSKLQIVFLEDKGDNATIIENAIKSSKPRINGIFFAGEVEKNVLDYLAKIEIPFLFIDFYSPLYNYNYLYVENYQLSYMLTQYLISHGHREIGFVGDITSTSSIADRFFGYKKALTENGLPFNEEWHINKNIEHVSDFVHLMPDNHPTAYVCHCDLAAYKIYMACSVKGLIVPNDISVISFDNTALCESISPTLTSAGINKETTAKKACSVMEDIILKRTKTINIILKTKLYERNSVKKIAVISAGN